jgi:hypothetical protein
MTFPNYAKTRNELLWIVPETTFNVLAQADQQYAVIPVEGVALPQASPEFTESVERNPSAGVRALIKRKIRPAEWSLPFYAKTAAFAGDPPSYGELMRCGCGVETLPSYATLETALAGSNDDLKYTARLGGTAGNSIQVEYLVAGLNTALSVSASATKITVNVATDGAGAATSTAAQVRAAIRASAACMALIRSVEFKTGNDGTGVVSALAAANLSGGTGSGLVTYALATDIDTLSVSIWHYTDNLMRGYRGGIVNVITLEGNGSDEGKITFAGISTYMVFAGVAKLEGAVTDVATSFVLEAGQARRFSVGPNPAATDFVYLQIENEVVKLTAVNYDTDTLTVARGQLGTTNVAHNDATELGPWKPAADTEPADIISPIVLGDITLDGTSTIGVAFSVIVNNNIEPRLDEYAQVGATGFRRSRTRQVTGILRGYAHQEMQRLLSNLDREKAENITLTLGSTGTGRLRIPIPVARFLEPPDVDGGGPEFQYEFAYQAMEVAGNDELTFLYD